ncbi:MAG TPA: TetR family transcriptional regulator [Candidatus Acidoferrales bacterium]|nr:TetR family transcriptional regulator [Candidatus Acidoferrales bacterium]
MGKGKAKPGRRERRRAETREKIFRAALGLYAARGLGAVTVEDITEAADVGKGTFFNYFPSKEHVFEAFGEMQIGKIEATLADVRNGKLSVRQAVVTLPRLLAEEPGRSPRIMQSLILALQTSRPMREIFQRKILTGRRMMAEILALGQRRGEIRRDVPAAELARAVQQAFFGAMLMWSLDETGTLARRFAETLEMVWPGVRRN